MPTPDSPHAEQGRLYARGTYADAWPFWLNESGQEQSFVMWKLASGHSIVRGLQVIVVAVGTRTKWETVTHNVGWTSTGLVFLTIQNANALAALEKPASVMAWSVGENSFAIGIDLRVNAVANRSLSIAWYADGVI